MGGSDSPASGDWRERGRLVRDVLLAGFLLSGIVYLAWRLTAFNVEAPIFSSVFWTAEVLAFAAALIRLYVTRRGDRRRVDPPTAAVWPEIDVFVTTYTEPVEVVRRTLAACAAMTGAHRTVLLDDGARAEMARLARAYGCDYLARTGNDGAKAGNLNHGLAGSSAALIAVFDADHAPERRFLERLVGYFDDSRVGFVQTPQDYFNTDSFQHGRGKTARSIWHEQSVFHWTEQPGRAALEAATCCGCSMMLRRAALDEVGGFPQETVTEDMHVSVLLHKAGWKSVYHAEPLAYGVAPAGPREFLRQRLRWGEGNMQVCRIEGVPFARNLSAGQNLAYLMLGTTYLEAWVKLIAYVSPIVFLFTFAPPIWSDMGTFFALFGPYLAFGLVAHVEFGRGYAPLLLMERFAMARLTSGLAATAGLFRRRIRFRVTGKQTGGGSGIVLLVPQAAILLLGLAGIGHAAWRLWDINQPPPPLWITVSVAVLAAYNALLAAWVLADALRTARLPGGAWLCPEPLPVQVGTEAPTRALAVSAERMVVPWTGPSPPGVAAVTVWLPSGPMTVPAELAGTRRGAATFAIRPSSAERDRLEADLLTSRWRRILAGRDERRPTWLEALRLLPAPARPRAWTWGLWQGADGGPKLACLRGEALVLFGAESFSGGPVVFTGEGVSRQGRAEPAAWDLPEADAPAVVHIGGAAFRFA